MTEIDLTSLRLFVYRSFVETGLPPTIADTSVEFAVSEEAIRTAFRTLDAAHILVIDPRSEEIWMAMPFSAVPTAYQLQSGLRRWWAN